MVSNKFKNEPGLLIQNKQDLEIIMNDRSLMLKQPIASRNLLLLGKYSRQLEKINVSVQLIDLATWDQIGSKDISAEYSDISKMKQEVSDNIRLMIASYLPNEKSSLAVVLPKFIDPKPSITRDPVTVKSEMVTKNLQQEFEKLEESMDVLLGLKEDSKLKPKNDVTLAIIRNFSKVKTVRENAMMIDDTERRERKSFGEFVAGWPDDDVIGLWLYLKKHGSRLGGNTGPFALRTLGVDTFLLTQDVEGFLRSHDVVDSGITSQRALRAAQTYFNDLREQSGKSLAELSRLVSFCHGQNRTR